MAPQRSKNFPAKPLLTIVIAPSAILLTTDALLLAYWKPDRVTILTNSALDMNLSERDDAIAYRFILSTESVIAILVNKK